MQLVLNKKILFVLLLLIGLGLGLGLVWGYQEYKDDFSDFIGKDTGDDFEMTEENDVPVYGAITQTFGFGENNEWPFYTFQPKVVEYKTENGVNYAIVEYHFGDVEEDLTNVTKYKMKVALTREDDWEIDNENLDKKAFEKVVKNNIVVKTSFYNKVLERWDEKRLTFNDLKKMFPVGEYIALAVPKTYLPLEGRTEEVCSYPVSICDYAKVWDTLSPGLDKFAQGGFTPEEDFVLIPWAISSDIYTWSNEGVKDQRDL